MNERIRELAEQAMTATTNKFSADREWSADEWREFYDTKFAESIVDRMLDITDAHTAVFQTDRDRALIEHIKQSVKQHFGVKE